MITPSLFSEGGSTFARRQGVSVHAASTVSNTWTYQYDLRGRQTSSSDPDKGTTTSTYDDANKLVTSTDARGATLWYGYDALGRKTAERQGSAAGTLLASWSYDTVAKGQLSLNPPMGFGVDPVVC